MTTVYVETSILSYLTARPTRDLLATARQQMTREWWDTRRARFDLFVSPLVEQEVRRGDPDAARRRVEAAHIALAAVHGMDYLLTWNCRHIDNAETKPVIRSVCARHGYACPEICTPEELMGDQDEC
ncbi:MAG TPA: DNA-binding protein [Verrucomicrobia bacterium]|nr:MAG: hypothetical protein A2X46_15185 [Lentisphaerae bacterium GWF2_57_35]HBA83283.1 DNA-binding protein [Verrucomicrobiota bacterium]